MTIEEFLTEPGSWEMYPGSSRSAKPRLRWRHSNWLQVWTAHHGDSEVIAVDEAWNARLSERYIIEALKCNT